VALIQVLLKEHGISPCGFGADLVALIQVLLKKHGISPCGFGADLVALIQVLLKKHGISNVLQLLNKHLYYQSFYTSSSCKNFDSIKTDDTTVKSIHIFLPTLFNLNKSVFC
jgi:hypothetical protein